MLIRVNGDLILNPLLKGLSISSVKMIYILSDVVQVQILSRIRLHN